MYNQFEKQQQETFTINQTEVLYLRNIYNLDFRLARSIEYDFFHENKTNKMDLLITNQTLTVQNTQIDGILGFAKPQIKSNLFKKITHKPQNNLQSKSSIISNFRSFQDDIYERFDVGMKIFSVYLNPESRDHYSYIVIGAYEPGLFKRRTLISITSTRDYAWSFDIESLSIGNDRVDFPIKQDTFISLMHNYIGLSGKIFMFIKQTLSQKYNSTTTVRIDKEGFIELQLNLTDNKIIQNFQISLHLSDNVKMDIIQKAYISQCLLQAREKLVTCKTKLKVFTQKEYKNVIILGTPFLEYYYSVYNQENNSITLGLANFSDLEIAQSKFWYYIFVLLIFLFAILLISVGIFYKEEFQDLVLVVKNTFKYFCCRDQHARIELINIANN